MKNRFYERYGLLILLTALCFAPFAVVGARKALATNNNNVRQWIPKDLEEAQRYKWFLTHFQGDEVAIVRWPGCTLDDPRVPDLSARIREIKNVDGTPTFASVVSGPEVVAQMTEGRSGLSEEEAVQRLKGVLVGGDGEATAVVARIRNPATADRDRAVREIRAACSSAGLDPATLLLGGPTVDSVNINEQSARALVELAGIAKLAALLICWMALRHWRLVAFVFASALFAELSALAIVYFSGTTMNSILMMLPTLVYVTTLSGSIHLVNYYKDVVLHEGSEGAVEKTAWAGWTPCLLSAATTAIGTGSLVVSRVVPVRDFGLYSAIGVMLSLTVTFTILLAALAWWPLRPEDLAQRKETNKRPSKWWRPIARTVVRNHTAVIATCVALIALTAVGLNWLQTSVKLQHLFVARSPILKNYATLEKDLGPLVPLEVVLRVDVNCSYNFLERVEMVRDLEAAIHAMPEVGGVMSAATFVPDIPNGTSVREKMLRGAMERAIPKYQKQFADADFFRQAGHEQLWRISARVPALGPLDYGVFVSRLQEVVEPHLKALHMPGVRAEYTGAIPLIYRAQRELLNDLVSSFLSAFALIAIALALSQRGLEAGLWAMLPNIFPIVVVFGVLGWLGFFIDIGTMMTASVGLGIAVDDTLHYLTWYRREREEGYGRLRSIMNSYKYCATAMLQTSVVVGFGLLPFAMSQFVPTGRFAYLMFFLLAVALVGDLVLLPALLSSKIGDSFDATIKTPQPAAATAVSGGASEAVPALQHSTAAAVAKTSPPKPHLKPSTDGSPHAGKHR